MVLKNALIEKKILSAFVGIKHIVRKIGVRNVSAKPLRPSFFARVVLKFLPRIKDQR
jgi:hypothetical protein